MSSGPSVASTSTSSTTTSAVRESPLSRIPIPSFFHTRKRILTDGDLHPDFLANNVRSGLYPDMVQRVINTIRQDLDRLAIHHVTTYESLHINKQCPKFSFSAIQPIPKKQTSSITIPNSNPLPSSSSSSIIRPWWWSSYLRWGFFQEGATLIGSEYWQVNRCDKEQVYRINYFRTNDDFFFVKVVPTNLSGWRDLIILKWNGKL